MFEPLGYLRSILKQILEPSFLLESVQDLLVLNVNVQQLVLVSRKT